MGTQQVGIEMFLDDARWKRESGQFDNQVKSWAGGLTTQINRVTQTGQSLFFIINGFQAGFRILEAAMMGPVNASSDLDEIINKFNVVMGPHAEAVEAWAAAYGDASIGIGRSKRSLLEMLSTLQDTFVPLGYARGEAAEMSKTLTQLIIDTASFNNKLDTEVLADFQSAIVGNHETVRKYGIIITEARLKQEAYRAGIIDTKRDLTAQEKVQARLNLIMDGTKDAQGDAARTANSYANVSKRLDAITEDLVGTLGQRFIPKATGAKLAIIGLFKSLQDLIEIPVTEQLEAQRTEMADLFTVAKDLNATEEIRKAALDEINTKYGDYLPALLTEKTSLRDIRRAQESVNTALLDRIAIEIQGEKIRAKMKEYDQLLDKEESLIHQVAAAEAKLTQERTDAAEAAKRVKDTIEKTDGVDPRVASANQDLAGSMQAVATGADMAGTGIIAAEANLASLKQRLVDVRKEQSGLVDETKALKDRQKELADAFDLGHGGEGGGNDQEAAREEAAQKASENIKLNRRKEADWITKESQRAEKEEAARLAKIAELRRKEARETAQIEMEEREKVRDAYRRDFETAAQVAMQIGEAFSGAINEHGIKGALKQALYVYLDYLQKLVLASQVEAGVRTMSGDMTALLKIAGITAAFQVAKAAIHEFAEGAIVTGGTGGVIARVGEGKHDELVAPLDGPKSPFGPMITAIERLEKAVRETPPTLINSRISGKDLLLVTEREQRTRIGN